ncbi:MAG: sigma-70 family RNA polymerase sigma factor [Sedimentisphaerales bacterium]|nr:sigma-70 family RNA polymerase sigma factor [Sedimentisphaerales bacterium]
MVEPSDEMLVRAVLAGEREAYEKLYDRYAALVRAVCYDTTRNLADAQDLAQDVFVRAYEKLEQLRDPERFGGWLVAIAGLRSREWRRQTLRNSSRRFEAGSIESVVDDPPDDRRIELLREKILMLPERERVALHAFYLQGKSADAARRVMGLSKSGFYCVLDRARKRLERLLVREMENIR